MIGFSFCSKFVIFDIKITRKIEISNFDIIGVLRKFPKQKKLRKRRNLCKLGNYKNFKICRCFRKMGIFRNIENS